jgi:hypothetical protein
VKMWFHTCTNKNYLPFPCSYRGWTGFNRVQSRSNYEDQRTGSADNRVDPMNIIPEWRDPFPKTNLDGKGNIVCCHIMNLLMLCAH